MTKVHDDKYIVFKREEFYELMGELVLPPWLDENGHFIGQDVDCAPLAQNVKVRAEDVCLEDAVVIRRQDYFASPALATYSACIAITAATTSDDYLRERLLEIADYFQRQSELAAEEGFHLPD